MEQKLRAAAYIRVSTSSRFQCHSYEFQVETLRRELQEKNEVELVAVYADKGISGKAMRNRSEFRLMMEAARNGEIDIIYCKSVSRFARNTTELLSTTRELREIGVAVYFETEMINTLDTSSELYLIIAAAVAENELSVCGERNAWSTLDNFKQGKMYYGNGVYGYTINKERRTLEVDPATAGTVRYIFSEYIRGQSADKIAKELNQAHIRPPRVDNWSSSAVLSILRNEKYVGDCMLQKTYMEKGVKKKNKGERDAFIIEDSHASIVSREDFERAKMVRESKPTHVLYDRKATTYPFTGLIECGCCGKHYTHKVNRAGTAYAYDIWACATATKKGRANCADSTSIKDETLRRLFVEAYNEFVNSDRAKVVNTSITARKERLLKDERELLRLRTKGIMEQHEYSIEVEKIRRELRQIDEQAGKMKAQNLRANECQPITAFDEHKLERFISRIVIRNFTVTFVFVNGISIEKTYENGKHGDIRDWIRVNGHPSTRKKEVRLNGRNSKE
jgi:DNA invertase Pin-like site-specific DNA recombinase